MFHQRRLLGVVVSSTVACTLPASDARALYLKRTTTEQLTYAELPPLNNADWTIDAWVHKFDSGTFQRCLALMNGGQHVVSVRLGGAGDDRVGLSFGHDPMLNDSAVHGALDHWTWISIVWNHAAQTLTLHAVNGANDDGTSITLPVEGPLPPVNRIELWSHSNSPMLGRIGCVAIRPGERRTLEAARALYQSRFRNAPMTHNNGLNLEGIIALNYGLAQSQNTYTGGPSTAGLTGTRIGSDVKSGNYLVYRKQAGVPNSGSLITVRPVIVSGPLVYEYDDDDSFWKREVPEVESGVVDTAPTKVQWALGEPIRRHVIAVCGNSRVSRATSYEPAGEQPEPALSYAGAWPVGLALYDIERLCGYIGNRIQVSGATRWPITDYPQPARTLGATLAPQSSQWTRLWISSTATNPLGGGRPLLIGLGQRVSAKFRNLPGSMFLSSHEVRGEYYFIAYPGAPALTARRVEAHSQGAPGTVVGDEWTIHDMDTTEHVRVLAETDVYDAATCTLTISGGFSSGYIPLERHMLYIATGPGEGDHNQIESISTAGDDVVITFRHDFAAAPPSAGSVVRLGPWEYRAIGAMLPPSEYEYRGIEFTGGSGAGPAVLCGSGAYRTDVPCFVFAALGWGGKGFKPQMDESYDGVIEGMMGVLQVEEAWLTDAYQSTSISQDFPQFASRVEAGGARAVYVVGQANSQSANQEKNYCTFALQQIDRPAICVSDHPLIGTQLEQLAYGEIHNTSHPGIGTFLRVAQALAEVASTDSEPSWTCEADLTGSGEVGVPDLLALLAAWGPCPKEQQCPADLTGNGSVGVVDLLVLLAMWGPCEE